MTEVEIRPWPRRPKYLVGDNGTIVGPRGRILRTTLHASGYPQIARGGWCERVHVIVCETFNGPRLEGMQVAHENGNPLDCRAVNLSWKTPAGNAADKIRHGTVQHGERNGNHRFTEADVRAMRAAAELGESLSAIALRFGTSHQNVGFIVRRETWRHVA